MTIVGINTIWSVGVCYQLLWQRINQPCSTNLAVFELWPGPIKRLLHHQSIHFCCVWHSPCSAQASSPLKPHFHCYVSNKFSPINGVLCDLYVLNLCPIHCTDGLIFLPSPVWNFSIFWRAGMMNHPPIPISELAEHTELLKANDNLKLSQEYEVSRPKVERSKFLLSIDFCLIVFSLKGDTRVPSFPRGNGCFSSLKSFFPTYWQCCSWWCLSKYEISVVLSHLISSDILAPSTWWSKTTVILNYIKFPFSRLLQLHSVLQLHSTEENRNS